MNTKHSKWSTETIHIGDYIKYMWFWQTLGPSKSEDIWRPGSPILGPTER